MAVWQAIYGLDGIYVGTDVTLNDTIYVSGTTTPQDITAWGIQFVIHQSGSTTALITKTVGSGITIVNGPAGQLSISLVAADTANLTPGTYTFRVERTDTGSDNVLTFGTVQLLAK